MFLTRIKNLLSPQHSSPKSGRVVGPDIARITSRDYFEKKLNFSGKTLVLTPKSYRRPIDKTDPMFMDHHKHWDVQTFLHAPRLPLRIAILKEQRRFSSPLTNNFSKFEAHGTLKRPDDEAYYLPIELMQFKEAVQHIINFQHAFDPYSNRYSATLTIHQGGVSMGKSQRQSGAHVDHNIAGGRDEFAGFYAVSDVLPTVYYHQPFEIPPDMPANLLNKHLNAQAREDCIWRPGPYDITFGDRYTVHRSDIAHEDQFRTFLRVIFHMCLGRSNPYFHAIERWGPKDVGLFLDELMTHNEFKKSFT